MLEVLMKYLLLDMYFLSVLKLFIRAITNILIDTLSLTQAKYESLSGSVCEVIWLRISLDDLWHLQE